MTRALSADDERQVQRYLDGELSAVAAAAFQSRLQAEPALRECVQQGEALRRRIRADRRPAFAAPAGFAADVLVAVRRLPTDGPWREDVDVLRWCRRILVAAAILFGLAMVWHAGFFRRAPERLEAAPDEVHQEMERLDAAIRGEAK